MKWMDEGVFTSFMPVMVNGSPSEDFKVLRGLGQGNPLSPFLFSIVVEGLAAVVRRDVSLDMLKGFKVNDEVSYSLLQFVDDTVLVCDGSWSNLWALKSILRGFEMASDLKINT